MRSLPLAAVLLTSGLAAAGPTAEVPTSTTARTAPSGYELGVRIGGYGFRRDGDPRPGEGWTECRMNGFGVFGGRDLRGPLFVEAGLDMYTSADGADPMDLPVDRTSGLISAAIGVRTNVTSWLRGYIQLGAGVELTRVSVPYGEERIRDNKAIPEGFFGFGGDLRVARGTFIGASFRTLMMGNFDYDPQRLDPSQGWVAAPASSEVFATSADVAAQAQFYVRREL